MADFSISGSGAVNDFVSVEINGKRLAILEQYEVRQQFFMKPDAFSVTLGSGDTAFNLITTFPPRSDYKLYIGSVLQQSGRTDGYVTGAAGGATTITLRGRDGLAPMLDAHIEAERDFGNMSMGQLAGECLKACGIDFTLFSSNEANRSTVAGVQTVTRLVDAPPAGATLEERRALHAATVAELGSPFIAITPGSKPTVARVGVTVVSNPTAPIKETTTVGKPLSPQKAKSIKAEVGETYYNFFSKHAKLRGLFLFAAVGEDNFVLAAPNTKQLPSYRILIERGLPRNAVNVISVRHRNEADGRHVRYVVYGRGGGGKAGRAKVRGEYVDEEMRALGFPDTLVWAQESDEAKTDAQALFLARRQCAEARRAGWEYAVTVQGHTAPSLLRPTERAVWTPDTIVEVLDYERGIFANLWVESVAFKRGGDGTTAELNLMRPDDLVFGEPEYQ